jgi:DNA repair protein RadD
MAMVSEQSSLITRFDPRWYQVEAVEQTLDFFNHKGGWDYTTNAPMRANPLICLPTGTGKSLVIAMLAWRIMQMDPRARLIMATHVKELIEQNAAKLKWLWPNAPLGINSAGLGAREFAAPIVYGGIKSMVGQLGEDGKTRLGHRDIMFVDEAHLISPSGDTAYLNFIIELMAANPWLKVIGLSATPYRMGLGHLTNGKVFTDVSYDLCNIEGFARLLADGFLGHIFPRPTGVKLDVSGVGMSNGDFAGAALEAAVDDRDTNYEALKEMVKYGWNRRSWMIFAAGTAHAEHLAETLRVCFGVNAQAIHSKMPGGRKAADEVIKEFKRGNLRCIVNQNMLTTGFDHPPIDLIGMFRPTMSTGLWVQMLGRGTRPWLGGYVTVDEVTGEQAYWPGAKQGCLVLDYAGNTPRLGPINDPVVPKPKSEGPPGDAPIRTCPEDKRDINDKLGCGFYNHSSAKFCTSCGFIFPPGDGPELYSTAGTDALIADTLPETKIFNVDRVIYVKHVGKKSGRSTIRCAYYCEGINCFYEYVTVEPKINDDGSTKMDFATKKGRDWFRQRTGVEPPEDLTNDEIVANSHKLRTPARITVWTNKKPSPEIRNYEF